MNVVFPDQLDIPAAAKRQLQEAGVKLYEDLPPTEAEVIKRVHDADIITANYIDLTPAVIDAATHLKYILVPAVGYDWVDVEHAKSKGIRVLNCPTFNSRAVAEHAVGLMFALGRHLTAANADLRQGHWNPREFEGIELHGRKLGLVGYGHIGRLIKPMAEGLGMPVSYTNSRSTPAELDELLKDSDIICLCLPLTDDTHHIINRERLALLKPGARLINLSRGGTIDQAALVDALKNRSFAGAALDVFEGEPLTGKPSSAIVGLANLPNVLATPHMAYNTEETARRLGEELWDNLQSCLAGAPINVVN